ncbi:MAG TPA: CPBP family glutamic-type intramembrane protease [Kofleriaceae bacterium]|nr:CPBP family glutamic-type intramembrane protease [Kofleriaceae bacterium]
MLEYCAHAAAAPLVYEVAAATGGLIDPTLIASAVIALCVVAVLVVSGVPLRELGLRLCDVPRALALMIALHGALQLAIVAVVLVRGERLVPAQRDASAAIGVYVAQLFGNTPVEEAVYRGFLFRQLVVRARLRGHGVGGVVAATALAAALFGLAHIPLRIHQGYHGLDLIATLVIAALGGALVSFLYVRGRNLMFLIVLHTLFNDQVPLFVSPVPSQWLFCMLAIGAIVWIELSARRGARMPWRRTPP